MVLPMKRPAVFFDRDNTLIACDGYLGDPEQVKLIAGAADAVACLRAMGFAIVTVSNQSGVARGLYTEADVTAVNLRMEAMLKAANGGAIVDRHEFCPYHPEGTVTDYRHESERRKPRPGMILEAARALALDLPASWLIGDAGRDIAAGKSAGVRTILFTDPTLPASPATTKNAEAGADFTVTTLSAAVEIISQHPIKRDEPTEPSAARKSAPPLPRVTLGKLSIPAASQAPADPLRPIETRLDDIARLLRQNHDQGPSDFSVPKLLAGAVQVLALAAVFFAYLYREKTAVSPILLTAIFLQVLTLSLLLMGRR